MINTKILLALALTISTCAHAQGAKFENDEANMISDLFVSKFKITGKYTDTKEDVCIAPLSLLQTLGASAGLVKVRAVRAVFRDDPKICDGSAVVRQDTPIEIESTAFKEAYPNRYGITFGGLVVPFKYQVAGSKDFKGGSSVGAYIGYRFDNNIWGFELKPIVFLGGGTVAVEQNIDGVKKVQNLAGFSAGIGLIGSFKEKFQIGLVLGADRVNKSAGYIDNGKGWIALSFGVPFSN